MQEAMADYADDLEYQVWVKFMAEHMPQIDPTEFSHIDLRKIKKTNVGVVLYGLWDVYLWEERNDG